MQLRNKTAIIYGATGAVGRTLARAFVDAGATVHVTGRRQATVTTLAKELGAHGAVVDATDEGAVTRHLASVPRVDISINAIGIPQEGIQGTPLVELDVDRFLAPVTTYTRAHFITARAAARRMVEQRGGVILTHTPSPAREGVPLVGGMGPAWSALEAMTRMFSAELAAHGVRTVCLRTTGLAETATIDTVNGLHARAIGVDRAAFTAMIESRTHRRRANTLAELAAAAVFFASDAASAFTGTTANLTGGIVVD